MAAADVKFIKNLEVTPVTVEYPVALYAVEEEVRERIAEEIKASGNSEGSACVGDVCFEWRVAKLGGDLQELSGDKITPGQVRRRVVVVQQLEATG